MALARRAFLCLLALTMVSPLATAQITAQAPEAQGLVAVQSFPVDGVPGLTTTQTFGDAVAGAGDVNGDGFADMIVGEWLAGAGAEGQAYIYYGGARSGSAPDQILRGEAAGDAFGRSVSGAGDVNGDGYADVVVGARTNDAAGASAGRAYVFFGGPAMDTTPDLILTGEAMNDFFGRAVAGAGDMNGDGYADVLVGADLNDAGGGECGPSLRVFRWSVAGRGPGRCDDRDGRFCLAGCGGLGTRACSQLVVMLASPTKRPSFPRRRESMRHRSGEQAPHGFPIGVGNDVVGSQALWNRRF